MRALHVLEMNHVAGGSVDYSAIVNDQFHLGGLFSIDSITDTVFPDSGLGVHDPNGCYAQVLIPGAIVKGKIAGIIPISFHVSNPDSCFGGQVRLAI